MPQSALSTLAGITAGIAGAALVFKVAQDSQTKQQQQQVMRELEAQMVLSKEKMLEIREEITAEMQRGLQGEKSSMMMLPSMVDFLPTGHEKGKFLSIDIGGTNFRVTAVELAENMGELGQALVEEQSIPTAVRRCHATKLFDWMAQTTIDFIKKNGINFGAQGPCVGFCFSFPVEQDAVDNGRLIKWNKGFDIEGSIGQDVVWMLESAFERCGMPARVAVLLNDSVGVLCASRYAESDTQVGVILGTGFNACYVEDVGRLATLPGGHKVRSALMVVNTEAGGFNGPSLPRLEEDVWLDCATPDPGHQVIEKMMSGLYLGEVVRRLLLRLVEHHGLLGWRTPIPKGLVNGFHQLTTPHVAAMHGDESPDRQLVAETLERTLGIHPTSLPLRARLMVQEVCQLAATRSARLLVTVIAAILQQIGRDTLEAGRTVVAIDGGMFEKYKQYREAVLEAKDLLLGHIVSQKVELRLTPDGSSFGAAGLAAAAMQTRDQTPEEAQHEALRTLSKAISPSVVKHGRVPVKRAAKTGQ